MFKSTALLALLTASASAIAPDASIPVDSKAGRGLMAQARQLDQNNQDDDMTWVAGYSIKYLGCSSLIQVREEGGGEEESNLFTMNLVKFGLCDSKSSCSSCGNGKAQYVVNMEAFVNAYTEMKMDAQEQACEYVRENCDCENANDDDACEAQCYMNMGMDECIEVEGDEAFDAQEYLECKEMEGANNNNNNNNGNYNNNNNNNGVDMWRQYFIGPVCSNGYDINLAVFYDEGCSNQVKKSGTVFEAFNYGASLPYEKDSMVSKECISCLAPQENDDDNNNNNNNNNGNQDVEVLELCEESMEEAAKCESGLSGVKYYPVTSGCEYINDILPKLEKASKSVMTYTKSNKSSSSGGGSAAVGWAIFFGITAAAMSAYAFFLYRKIHRAKVNLSAAEGATMA